MSQTDNYFDWGEIGQGWVEQLSSLVKIWTLRHILKDFPSWNDKIIGVHPKDEMLCKVIKRPKEISAYDLFTEQIGDSLFWLISIDILYYFGNHYLYK